MFIFGDSLRNDVSTTVEKLRDRDCRLALVSGDGNLTTRAIGDKIGIQESYGDQLPWEKAAFVHAWQKQGSRVAMVGDGINDAPALASAHVGVAMGAAGTDIALETADIALTHDDISSLPWLVRLSHRMLKIIKINIVFGLLFNAIAVLVSGMGWLTPIMAAIVHNIGSVLVVVVAASLVFFPDNSGLRKTR